MLLLGRCCSAFKPVNEINVKQSGLQHRPKDRLTYLPGFVTLVFPILFFGVISWVMDCSNIANQQAVSMPAGPRMMYPSLSKKIRWFRAQLRKWNMDISVSVDKRQNKRRTGAKRRLLAATCPVPCVLLLDPHRYKDFTKKSHLFVLRKHKHTL